jgi:Family of unknown function (DUF6152)
LFRRREPQSIRGKGNLIIKNRNFQTKGIFMKKILYTFFAVVAVLSMAVVPLLAHHGRGAAFDMKKQVTMKGVVTQVLWRNPHVRILMDIKDETGVVRNWSFENTGTANLAQGGYSKNTLRVGQELTVVANPAANGTIKFVTTDGKEVMSRWGGGTNPLD